MQHLATATGNYELFTDFIPLSEYRTIVSMLLRVDRYEAEAWQPVTT